MYLPMTLAFIARHLSIRPGKVPDPGCGPGHLRSRPGQPTHRYAPARADGGHRPAGD